MLYKSSYLQTSYFNEVLSYVRSWSRIHLHLLPLPQSYKCHHPRQTHQNSQPNTPKACVLVPEFSQAHQLQELLFVNLIHLRCGRVKMMWICLCSLTIWSWSANPQLVRWSRNLHWSVKWFINLLMLILVRSWHSQLGFGDHARPYSKTSCCQSVRFWGC